MSVTIRKRKTADGGYSLRLDIWHNGIRAYEPLKHLRLAKGTNLLDRENNKELMKQAEAIRVARAAEIEANGFGLVSDAGKKTLVVDWMQAYADNYKKKDVRIIHGVLNRFRAFLLEKKKANITFIQLNALLIEDFIEYLEDNAKGEGAASYYARFKKMVRNAYRKRLMRDNVLDFVERKPKGKAAKKDALTTEEIKTLIATHTESKEVRKAAIFSLMTGLAWVDVSNLQWKQIDFSNKRLKHIERSKTDVDIFTPLNDAAIKIVGTPGKADAKVFKLPTANAANKTLKAWVKRAGIGKKITWHNLRHSAGTNLAFQGVDILTISKILAQTSVKHTQRYVDAANEMKIKATDKLNVKL